MIQTNISKKKYYLVFTFYFLGFGVIVALLTSLINYKSNFTDIDNKLQNLANSEAKFKRGLLFDYISEIEMLLSSVTRNELTLKYINSREPDDKKNLTSLFYALSYANSDIMQLRYIDASGKETIRIDRDKKTPELLIVPESKMQDKGGRYYFKETLLLMANQFWHSNIDLNIEHGKIEQPVKPTFRVATQLVVKNQFKGIIIANLLFENTIKEITNSANFQLYIADKDGEIIHHPDRSGSWSKYLNNIETLHDLFPDNMNDILKNSTFKDKGIYSYTFGDLFRNSENLKIIFTPKSNLIKKIQDKNILAALVIAATVLLVSIPLSWIVSIIPSQLQSKLSDAYNKIKKNAEIIDKHVMISSTDKDGLIKDISTCFTKTTGYTADEVVGKQHNILRHPDTSLETHKNLWETILSGKIWEGDIKDLNKNGQDIWIHKIITPEFNKNGEIDGFTAIANDISDKKIIEHMSVTDRLTGLYNRHKLEDVLSNEMARFDRYKSNFSVILFDIDCFKKLNDTYGHLAGDEVLIHLSDILKKSGRETDCISRWGGEEFLIVSSETDIDGAFVLAENLRKKIETFKFTVVGKVISGGVAQYASGETTSELVSRADVALYKAKKSGRNNVVRG